MPNDTTTTITHKQGPFHRVCVCVSLSLIFFPPRFFFFFIVHPFSYLLLCQMFFWPKLLAMALAVAGSVEHYLALYLWHIPSLNLFAIGMLIALVMVVRLLASTVFIWLVDRSYPAVHLHMLLALTIVGTIALLGVFSMSAFDTYWIMILTLCWMLANGLFFQPLASLVDSAIIKSLGDYKIWLYGKIA